MIRCIAAIDEKRGIADEHGIPWQGKLPTEVAYYREKIKNQTLLMGSATYKEHKEAPEGSNSFVLTSSNEVLKPGFTKAGDLQQFLQTHPDVWVIGGAGVFAEVIDVADELYLSRVQGDFNCIKFFPEFEGKFHLIETAEPRVENGIIFHFEVWQKNKG